MRASTSAAGCSCRRTKRVRPSVTARPISTGIKRYPTTESTTASQELWSKGEAIPAVISQAKLKLCRTTPTTTKSAEQKRTNSDAIHSSVLAGRNMTANEPGSADWCPTQDAARNDLGCLVNLRFGKVRPEICYDILGYGGHLFGSLARLLL